MNQRPYRDLFFLLGLALVFRSLFLLAMPRVVDSADALHYMEAAQHLSAWDWATLNPRIPPLYPMLCAPWAAIGVDVEWACRWTSFVAGLLAIVPIFLTADSLFGRRPARVIGTIVSIWPWIADWSCRIAPESTAMFLWFTGLWCVLRGMNGRAAWFVGAGVAYFGLHLARPEGLYLMMAAGFGVGVLGVSGGAVPVAKRLGVYAATCLSLLAVQYAISGLLTGEAQVQARVSAGDTMRYVFIERGSALVQTFFTVIGHNIPVMTGPYMLLFAGVGIFTVGEGRKARAELFLFWMAASQIALAILSTWPEPRYVMAAVIAIALYAARGMIVVGDTFRAAGYRRLVHAPVAGIVALMLIGTAATVGPERFGGLSREPREYRAAGEWLKEHMEPGLVITRKPQVGFYAGMRSTGPLPSHSVPRMIEWMRAIDGRYLVVDERYTVGMNPALRPLIDPENAPAEFRLLIDDLSEIDGARIVIYELLPE